MKPATTTAIAAAKRFDPGKASARRREARRRQSHRAEFDARAEVAEPTRAEELPLVVPGCLTTGSDAAAASIVVF
jgi:hypothetical protein